MAYNDFGIAGPFTGGGGGGFLEGLGNLFKDKQFLSYLSALGAGIAGPNSTASALDTRTQQNIQTQNYSSLLGKILGGEMPGYSLSVDDKGLTMKAQRSTPIGELGPNPGQTGIEPLQMDSPQPKMDKYTGDPASPFALGQLNLTASDLAGLTPELISNLMQLKMAKDEQVANRESAATERDYKSKLMQKIDAEIAAEAENRKLRGAEADNDAEKNRIAWYKAQNPDKPADQLMYEYDVKFNGFKGSIKDWKDKEPNEPAEMRMLNRAMTDPAFKKIMIEMRRAGATNVNISPGEKVMQEGLAKDKLTVLDPDFADNVRKQVDSGVIAMPEAELKPKVVNAMGAKIRSVFGDKNVTPVQGGWIVKDPDSKREYFIRGPQ